MREQDKIENCSSVTETLNTRLQIPAATESTLVINEVNIVDHIVLNITVEI